MTLLSLLLASLIASATPRPFDHEYKDFATVLNQVVVETDQGVQVDYPRLQKRPQELIRFLKTITRLTEKRYKQFSPDEQKAFLINAYNAFTLQLIKDNLPLTSLDKIPGLKDPWGLRFARLFGRERSLKDVEKMLLEFHDPRLLLAISRGAVSSPPLRPEPYVPNRLNDQLDDQARRFLRDTSRNRLDLESKVVRLASVFKRFESEFQKEGMTLQKFVAPFMSDDANVRADLENGVYSVEHLEPDWKLNKLSK